MWGKGARPCHAIMQASGKAASMCVLGDASLPELGSSESRIRSHHSMARCRGTTRKGNRCSITSTSTMTDDGGRLVSQPLRCGGDYCALHAKPFVVRPAPLDETAAVLIFLDLETTGVDVARDRIVEIAATHAPADPRLEGSSYSTVVSVDPQILNERRGGRRARHH